MANKFQLYMPGNIEVPKKYKDILPVLMDVGKLFKNNSCKFVYINLNGTFYKKLVNPRYRKVNEQEFMSAQNIGKCGFIINSQDGKEYYNEKI